MFGRQRNGVVKEVCALNFAAYSKFLESLLPAADCSLLCAEDVAFIDMIIDDLGTQTAAVVRMSYGLKDGPHTQAAIGLKLGISDSRVSQILKRARTKFRHPARTRSIETFIKASEGERKYRLAFARAGKKEQAYTLLLKNLLECDTIEVVDQETMRFVDLILKSLGEREELCIRHSFDLFDIPKTSKEVCRALGVASWTSACSIESKAREMLYHPSRLKVIGDFVRGGPAERGGLLDILSDGNFVPFGPSHHLPLPSTIHELDLSVRAYNALKSLGLENLADLPLSADKASAFLRRHGKKTLREIEVQLQAYGARFSADVS